MSRTPPVVPDLPEIPTGASLEQLVAWVQNLRTAITTREPIASGDKLNKFVTRGELVNLNVLTLTQGGTFGVGSLAGGGSEVIGGGVPVYDDSPPDPITGLTVTGMLTHFLVEFDAPTYTNGGGNAYTEIYAANYAGSGPLPTFADAVLVYELSGSTTIAAIPAQPAQTTCFWVGTVTRGGNRQVDGVGPTGGLHGVEATTGADVSGLLEVLNNEITETQLFSALGARVDLIDGPSSTTGTVNQRIAASASSLDGAITAAISTESTARVNADNTLGLQWTVKLDANDYVSGFGLASAGPSSAPTSTFIIRADSFTVGSPSGPGITPVTPFMVVTTPTTINGVSVPVGVYMDAAYIANGTITNAKIGNAAIDDAKIANLSAAKITAGSVAVGEYLQSTGYVSGSAGWRITGNGVAELAAASIRGQLVASQIGAGTIDATKINVSSLDAITATIGTLRTAPSGARTELSDNRYRVFDASNVCRIKLGDLS